MKQLNWAQNENRKRPKQRLISQRPCGSPLARAQNLAQPSSGLSGPGGHPGAGTGMAQVARVHGPKAGPSAERGLGAEAQRAWDKSRAVRVAKSQPPPPVILEPRRIAAVVCSATVRPPARY